MPISGIIVNCRDGCAADVAGRMAALAGVEVHGLLPDSRIVAVVESGTVSGEVDLVARLHDLDGVVAVRLAYHNFEQ